MKILIPIDGSQVADNAVRWVCQHLSQAKSSAQIVLLHVVRGLATEVAEEITNEGQPYAEISAKQLQAYYQQQSEPSFAQAQALLERAGLAYRKVCRVGEVVDRICQCTQQDNVDLIVMGSNNSSNAQVLLFGSVLTGVLAQCNKPILVVGEHVSLDQAPTGKVVIAMDDIGVKTKPLAYILDHQNLFSPQTRYELVHVRDTVAGSSLNAVEEKSLKTFGCEDTVLAGKSVVTCVNLYGSVAKSLASYCRAVKSDILVMGSHGYGRLRSSVLGSVVRSVASLSTVPLLIIH